MIFKLKLMVMDDSRRGKRRGTWNLYGRQNDWLRSKELKLEPPEGVLRQEHKVMRRIGGEDPGEHRQTDRSGGQNSARCVIQDETVGF